MTQEMDILLIEDNPEDVEITLRAFHKHHIANKIHVVRDGEEALECLFHRTVCGGKSLPEYTAHPSRSQAPEGRRAGNLTEGQERSTHETHSGRRADLLA